MTMTTARQKVLEYLQQHTRATARDISLALKMTPANARHHLRILEQMGLVTPDGERPQLERGRPAAIFKVNPSLESDNLPLLSATLMRELLASVAPAEQENLLKRLALGMLSSTYQMDTVQKQSPKTLTGKLIEAVERLNFLKYQARWEARRGSPRLILRNCPYGKIIHHFPQFCQMDSILIEELLGKTAEQASKLEKDKRGVPSCAFIIR